MRASGSGSPTDAAAARRAAASLSLLLILAVSAGPVPALDLFTLWQRPELPLNLVAGQWADYRRQGLTEGRRTEDLLRIQCLGQDAQGRWLIEVLPLAEPSRDVFEVVPGEGLQLRLTAAVAERAGSITSVVDEVRLWRQGQVQLLDREEWRRDPLVTASFSGDFQPDLVSEQPATTRVISGKELLCRQFVFAATDTQVAASPLGRLLQASHQEVAAAVHPDLPLLGLAFVTERLRSETWLEPPSQRRLPPPQVRVELLECIGFGVGARPALSAPGAMGD